MRISDWSSDVCSSDLAISVHDSIDPRVLPISHISINLDVRGGLDISEFVSRSHRLFARRGRLISRRRAISNTHGDICRSEEHTSELQSLMRISYAVFCLKQKKNNKATTKEIISTKPSTKTKH